MDDRLLDLAVPSLPAVRSVAPARAGLEKLALTTMQLTRAGRKVDPNPTEGQKDAGNYRKGHVSYKGLRITIETAKGQYRSGVADDGKPWKQLMRNHYGYIKGSEGRDGDQVDVFLGDDLDSEIVFVVNQVRPGTKRFDEHKVLIGFHNEAGAREAYLKNYEPLWTGLKSITPMTLDQFKWWLEHADTRKEIKDGFWAHPALRKAAEYKGRRVVSWVPRPTLDSVRKHGLLGSKAIIDRPDALAALAGSRGRTPDEFAEAVRETMGSWKKYQTEGPNVFFHPPPPSARLSARHPSRTQDMVPVGVRLDDLLHDVPDTRLYGMELEPYDPTRHKTGTERHRYISPGEADAYLKKTPEELWSTYSDPKDEGMYAPDVPHASIHTPDATVPPQYLEFPADKVAGYNEEKVDKARAVVDKTRSEHDMDGIYVYVNPEVSLAWVDIMDWGDGETGRVLEMRLQRLFQDVVMRNESAQPRGPGWVKLWPGEKRAAAPVAMRPLTEQDIPRLLDIERASFPDDPYDEGVFKDYLANMKGIGAHEGDTLTGYMIHKPVESRPGHNYVQSIAVHPEHRRKGIATALLDHLKQQGDITLDVRANNRPALALYKKKGFGHETTFLSERHGPAHHLSTSAKPDDAVKTGFEANPPYMLLVKRADRRDSPFTIAVDLDGTVAEKQEPFDPDYIGEPRERAVYWLRLFRAAGARVIIFTVRGDTALVKKWLKDNDVPFDYVNENPDQPPDSSGKVWADCYWDDKAYNAEDPDEFGPEILHRAAAHGKKDEGKKEPGPVHVSLLRSTTIIMAAPDILDALEAA